MSDKLVAAIEAARADGLTSDDLQLFAAIGVDPQTLEAAGVRRVDHHEALEICGIRYQGAHLEGVPFPYFNPSDNAIVTWRVRRDHP